MAYFPNLLLIFDVIIVFSFLLLYFLYSSASLSFFNSFQILQHRVPEIRFDILALVRVHTPVLDVAIILLDL